MLESILNLSGVKKLDKRQQVNIRGGGLASFTCNSGLSFIANADSFNDAQTYAEAGCGTEGGVKSVWCYGCKQII